MQKKIYLHSIGCRTNQEEVALLRAALTRTGFTVVEEIDAADIIVLNTCSVTAHTESKITRLIGSLSRQAPGAKILVTGCMAERRRAEFLKSPNVSWVVGNGSKETIPAIIRDTPGGLFLSDLATTPLPVPPAPEPPGVGGRSRYFLKIQEGCDRRCAYCIVPFLRGPSRSAAAADIERSLRAALDAGYKEIVLTGTHIGHYRDADAAGLLPLVERLLGVDGDFRLRLSSLDGEEPSGRFLTLIGEGGKLCDHLHVSLQSLSEPVLRSMNRPCSGLAALVGRLSSFRERYPTAGLGADFIVGFPGEAEAQFEETLANAGKIGFSYAHIFRYSSRPGTAAAGMRGLEVPEAEKQIRADRLRAVIAKSAREFGALQVGAVRRIITEGDCAKGITANYLRVDLPGISALPNSWLDVIIEESASGGRQFTAHPLHAARNHESAIAG